MEVRRPNIASIYDINITMSGKSPYIYYRQGSGNFTSPCRCDVDERPHVDGHVYFTTLTHLHLFILNWDTLLENSKILGILVLGTQTRIYVNVSYLSKLKTFLIQALHFTSLLFTFSDSLNWLTPSNKKYKCYRLITN
jgi:hypothetical protein